MGADLYLYDSFEKHAAQYETMKNEALAKRNAIENRYSQEYKEAQEEVERVFDLIWDTPYYFRDSYNNGIFLNKIGLSWWQDISPRCRKRDGLLPLRQAKWFLNQIKKGYKKNFNAKFEEFFEKISVEYEYGDNKEKERQEWLEFYENRFNKLQEMLETSIATKELIYCSL